MRMETLYDKVLM